MKLSIFYFLRVSKKQLSWHFVKRAAEPFVGQGSVEQVGAVSYWAHPGARHQHFMARLSSLFHL